MKRAENYPYTGIESLREPVLQALHRVVDPEVAMSIVDVGLIYGVTATPERLHVVMTMTSAACPVAGVILEDIEFELEQSLPEGFTAVPELVWEPPWTPERMTARGRRSMGW